MKIVTSPIVTMLDIFMLLILGMIMEHSPNIKIVLPQTSKHLQESIAISIDKDGKMLYYFDETNKEWSDIKNLYLEDPQLIGKVPCKRYSNLSTCKDLPKPPKGEATVYFQGKLKTELSFLITDSCIVFPQKCTQVTYHITKNGRVDRRRLLREYPWFDKIINVKALEDKPHNKKPCLSIIF